MRLSAAYAAVLTNLRTIEQHRNTLYEKCSKLHMRKSCFGTVYACERVFVFVRAERPTVCAFARVCVCVCV